MYQLTQTSGVKRLSDGAFIPSDDGNRDWMAYRAWLAAGNVPSPAPTVPPARGVSPTCAFRQGLAGRRPRRRRGGRRADPRTVVRCQHVPNGRSHGGRDRRRDRQGSGRHSRCLPVGRNIRVTVIGASIGRGLPPGICQQHPATCCPIGPLSQRPTRASGYSRYPLGICWHTSCFCMGQEYWGAACPTPSGAKLRRSKSTGWRQRRGSVED